MQFDKFDVLTFDCYGTLVDWEAGIWGALEPVFAEHRVAITKDAALELFGALESGAQSGAYVDYKSVLRTVLTQMGAARGFTPSPDALERFALSVGEWPPFPDTADALKALQRRFKLAVISNIDDDLFALTARRLGVEFDWVITAAQSHAYKPAHAFFEFALARIGAPRARVLHVAQSLFHDIAPASALGLSTVWVNRRAGQTGAGATPQSSARADLEVPDLRTLAALAESE